MPRVKLACSDCLDASRWCRFCGACQHDTHTEECKQNWRSLILSYKVNEVKDG